MPWVCVLCESNKRTKNRHCACVCAFVANVDNNKETGEREPMS